MNTLQSRIMAIVAFLFIGIGSLSAVPVDLELSFVVDISGSINGDVYQHQMDGYANAFRRADIQSAILGGAHGAIAVNLIFYASHSQEGIGFTLLDSVDSINAFADELDNFDRPFTGGTSIRAGLHRSVRTFGDETGGAPNGFESTRQVIDISGDGEEAYEFAHRDDALAAGIDTINGLAIEHGSRSNVATHFLTNVVIGGTDASVLTVISFDPFDNVFGDRTRFNDVFGEERIQFDNVIAEKLRREIRPIPASGPSPVPEPSTFAMMVAGLIYLGISRRRKKWLEK